MTKIHILANILWHNHLRNSNNNRASGIEVRLLDQHNQTLCITLSGTFMIIFFAQLFCLMNGTIIWTGIIWKKITCYMRDSACRWFIVKKAKYFEFMLNIIEFSRVWENVESWLVYASKLFWIAWSFFWTDIIKRS